MTSRNLWADAENFMRAWVEAREDAMLIDDAERNNWTGNLRNFVRGIAWQRLVRGEKPAIRPIWMTPEVQAYYRANGRSLRAAKKWRDEHPGRFMDAVGRHVRNVKPTQRHAAE